MSQSPRLNLPLVFVISAQVASAAVSVSETERLEAIAARVEAGCRQVGAGLAQPNP